MENKNVSESRSNWTALLVILNLSVLGSFALTYFYSGMFSWENTLPATLTYFSLYYFLFFSEVWPRFFNKVWCRREERLVGPKESSTSIDSEVKSKWYVNFFSGEFTAFFILFFINVCFWSYFISCLVDLWGYGSTYFIGIDENRRYIWQFAICFHNHIDGRWIALYVIVKSVLPHSVLYLG